MTGLSAAHRDALAMVVGALQAAKMPWWVIAGAAVALHSRQAVAVGDIDILIGMEDVPLVRDLPGLSVRSPDGNRRFRSRFYAGLNIHGVEVEWMAGFELCHTGYWEAVLPKSRVMMNAGHGLYVPVPDRAELAAMLTRFGRTKDLARIALLTG